MSDVLPVVKNWSEKVGFFFFFAKLPYVVFRNEKMLNAMNVAVFKNMAMDEMLLSEMKFSL